MALTVGWTPMIRCSQVRRSRFASDSSAVRIPVCVVIITRRTRTETRMENTTKRTYARVDSNRAVIRLSANE